MEEDLDLRQDLERFILLSTNSLQKASSSLLSAHPLPSITAFLRARLLDGDEEGASRCATALVRLLSDPAVVATLGADCHPLLCEALGAPAADVRALPARLLGVLCRGDAPWPPGLPRGALLAGGGALLGALVDGVADPVPALAELCGDAAAALAAAAPSPEELAALAAALRRVQRSDAAREDSAVMLRVLTLAARVAGESEAACALLAAAEECGGGSVLGALLAACGDDCDPLLQLNALEGVGFLGASERGLALVCESPLLDLLFTWSGGEEGEGEEDEKEGADPLLAGAALDALAALYAAAVKGSRAPPAAGGTGSGGGGGAPPAASPPRSVHLRARLLPALLRALARACRDAGADVQGACAALRALLVVAAADPAPLLGALLEQADAEPPPAQALRQWFELCESSDAELRAAALGALAALLRVGRAAGEPVVALLLRVFSGLSAACRGGGGGARSADPAARLSASVAVLQGALALRVPPLGVQGESEGAPHLARWAAYGVLEALCALPCEAAPRAVLAAPGLGAALLAEGGEASVKGRAHAQAVVAAALSNPAAPLLGPELLARLHASVAKSRGEGRAQPAEPGVAVAERTEW
jgi:hypothetical protein